MVKPSRNGPVALAGMYGALQLHDPAAQQFGLLSLDASPNERGHGHGSATFCCSVLLAARNEIEGKVLWKILVQRCACETNPETLTGLIYQAEEAMFLRSQELTGEEEELRQAARQLLELKISRLGWPDPLKVGTQLSESA